MELVEGLVWGAPVAGALVLPLAWRRRARATDGGSGAVEPRYVAVFVGLAALALTILGSGWIALALVVGAGASALAPRLGSGGWPALGIFTVGALWLAFANLVYVEGADFARWTAVAWPLAGLVLGASSCALFSRIGGAVVARAIEDEPGLAHADRASRRPEVALFASYVAALIGAVSLGLGLHASHGGHLGPVVLPLGLAAAGVICALVPARARLGAAAAAVVAAFALARLVWPGGSGTSPVGGGDAVDWLDAAAALAIGLSAALSFAGVRSFVRELPALTRAAASMAILAFAAALGAHLAGFYGVALVAVGTMAGVGLLREEGELVTAGAASMSSLALFAAFMHRAGIAIADLERPGVVVSALLGGGLPWALGALARWAQAEVSRDLASELARPGVAPDLARATEVAFGAALRRLVLPCAAASLIPAVIGFGLGPEALAGAFAGVVVSGVAQALLRMSSRRDAPVSALMTLVGAVALVIAPLLS